MKKTRVVVEAGKRRTFASALDWPGWVRSAGDEDAALEALAAYGARYKKALGSSARDLTVPESASGFTVVERVAGDATTDFGAPNLVAAEEEQPVSPADLKRLTSLLRGAWKAFDKAADAAEGATLALGPRGGGRNVEGMRAHVFGADRAYLGALCATGLFDARKGGDDVAALRDAIVEALGMHARGEPLPPSRRQKPPWPVRYAVRRSAWHALDHAWEIQDRAR